MTREFNITGTCIPSMHYMVDISAKLKDIFTLIEKGKYFAINRPRQFGKTTTLSQLKRIFRERAGYMVSSISFEGVGDAVFENEKTFSPFVLKHIGSGFSMNNNIKDTLYAASENVTNLQTLSAAITSIVSKYNNKFILMIDEVDKSSNNQLFLSFLGMLRNKYLLRADGDDYTFHSVILAGVHDVKTLKLKLRPDDEQKYNSPWNIASDFKVDMSFNPAEIATMLLDYANAQKVEMDIPAISQRIYHYTSGYPFLVSRICKEIDEELMPVKKNNRWEIRDVDDAVKVITNESNTNFDNVTKNIENNAVLYERIVNMVSGNMIYRYSVHDPIIQLGALYGLFKKSSENKLVFHNRIYEEILTEYVTGVCIDKEKQSHVIASAAAKNTFIKPDGRLDFEKVLQKFQEIIKEKYSKSDVLKSDEFLEKDLRLLFLVFLKPIINGIGFSFKEVETSEEKRMDIIVIFRDEKFVVELKIWRGEEYHKQGITRLKDYMKREGVNKGYMLIIDKKRSKEFVSYTEKGILMVWV